MKILVIGDSEYTKAIVKQLFEEDPGAEIFFVPGDLETEKIGESLSLAIADLDGIKEFLVSNSIDLTMVSVEMSLTCPLVDELGKEGFLVYGPTKAALNLETSHVFAKGFMFRHQIPTAPYQIAYTRDQAYAHLCDSNESSFVLKIDGLTPGNRVLICESKEEVLKAIRFWNKGVVIEEKLEGWNITCVVCIKDGKAFIAEFIRERDSQEVLLGSDLKEEVLHTIVFPTINGMLEEGLVYYGVLLIELMMTEEGPIVLKYKCHYGDFETIMLN